LKTSAKDSRVYQAISIELGGRAETGSRLVEPNIWKEFTEAGRISSVARAGDINEKASDSSTV